MGKMICQYCNHTLKNKSSLNAHQKKTKYCLKIQGKLDKGKFICECGKDFYSKHHLTDHQGICSILNTTYVQELKKYKPITEKVDLSFDFYFKSHPLDSDNCGYMSKLIIDCMVEAKMLKNDDTRLVGWFSCRSNKGLKDFVRVTVFKGVAK